MAPPVVQTSLFAQASLDELALNLSSESRRHVYTRGQNPTVEAVEVKLARLERGAACKVFGSGMAAVGAALFGLLAAGDHVLFVNQIYGPTLQLARRLERFGVSHDVVLDLDVDAVEAAIRPATRLIWIESPGTMTFRVLDVGAVTALARGHGILTVMDNSWSTPLLQKPITAGVDVVVHSATKYLGGHSDLVAGAVVGSAEILERIFYDAFLLLGGILGPFDAWLLNRGMRTLPERLRRHHASALAVARHLQAHPRVRRVFHPGLHEDLDGRIRAQLGGFSGLFSFELDSDDYREVAAVVDALTRFRIGVSWGGVESLVLSPCRPDNREALARLGIPYATIRLSIGLEPVDTLVEDLTAALSVSAA